MELISEWMMTQINGQMTGPSMIRHLATKLLGDMHYNIIVIIPRNFL